MEKVVKILKADRITRDVVRFLLQRPEGYSFRPGQATEVSINRPGWESKTRPFTFTGREDDDELEFTIKVYKDHDGVTKVMGQLKPGDGLIIRDVWGTIRYNGPGVFIAGGAGITPFIAILRKLKDEGNLGGHALIFSNKESRDVIMEEDLRSMLGDSLVLTLTREEKDGYLHGRISSELLKEKISDFSQNFYVCGPHEFVQDVNSMLKKLGASPDAIVFEK